MRKRISQREARRLKLRVEQMERAQEVRFNRWGQDFPGGVHVRTIATTLEERAALKVVEAIGYAIVGRLDENWNLKIFAVKP